MHTALRLLMLVIGLASAGLALSIYRHVQEVGRDSLVDLGFNTPSAVHFFRMFYVGLLILLVGFGIYTVGGVLDDHTLISVAEAFIVGFFLFPLRVFYAWWRRVA